MNYVVNNKTTLENFSTIGDFSVLPAGASVSAVTNYLKTGTASVQLTAAVGDNGNITKTISADYSKVDRFSLSFYIHDLSQLVASGTALVIYISSTANFSKYFSYSIAQNILQEGWNTITFPKSEMVNTGSDDWANTMITIRYRHNAKAACTPIVTYDAFFVGGYGRPKVIFTFDDNRASQYTQAYDYMKKYGFRGTIFVMPDKVDLATYMTMAQMREMYNAGWDMSVHDDSNDWTVDYPTVGEMQTRLTTLQNYLISSGFTRHDCHRFVAYPVGINNANTRQAVRNKDMLGAVTQIGRVNDTTLGLDDETLICRRNLGNTEDINEAKGWLDDAIERGGTIIFTMHNILVTATTGSDWPIADFQTFVDYIYSKKEQIDMVTLSEWYQGLTNSRKQIEFNLI